MRNAPGEPRRTEFICACCRRTITTAIEGLFYNPPVGSPQRFCSSSCRQKAWRRRRAGVPEATPLQWRGGRSRRLRQDVPAPQTPYGCKCQGVVDNFSSLVLAPSSELKGATDHAVGTRRFERG
jgi:hypothetical protein